MLMETLPPPAAAAAGGCPGWAMLNHYAELEVEGDGEDSTSNSGGAKITEAASRSSYGHLVRVSLRLEAPPAASQLSFHCSPCSKHRVHGPLDQPSSPPTANSVLVEMHYEKGENDEHFDYFVYNAGAAAVADEDGLPRPPPSLSLFPTYWVPLSEVEKTAYRPHQSAKAHQLREGSTGLLRRRRRDTLEGAELVVLRSGEWSATPISPIVHDDGKGEELSYWEADMAVPVGDRRLCYVDLYRGVILCDDVFDEQAPLRRRPRYVPLPVEAPAGAFDEEHDRRGGNRRHCLLDTRTVCAIDGGATLKFVDIFPRCCCGRRGATQCDHSGGAFVIHTWTMRMDNDGDMSSWTMDAMIDATELWSLDA
ncbi:hypothetical protein OsJ_33154 [Oryza sativa Japonica Group]|uniref:DUF1618 domain-containing protein n=1 Tax=Oryza sativa subsp. japonica TaxID=39947 RepID=A3C955_ORYSJ|nr:hypothetical protein OsJ_33154 [Oryza sativa Japonica Group]